MSNFQHNLNCKVNSLCRLFSKVVIFDHQHNHHHQGGDNDIEDGWEYIEVLDRELGSAEENEDAIQGEDIEMDDQGVNFFSFSSLEQPNYTEKKYKVLSRVEIRQRLEDKITKMCSVLELPRNEAAILLQQFKWSVSRTNEEWLTCEEKVRKAVGLVVKPVKETPADATESICRICYRGFPRDFMNSVSCGHQFCRSCWEGYIREAINDGPQCLQLRCPTSSCDAAVGLYFIELHLSLEDDKKKYENHLLRTYIAQRRKAKWCPAPDCNYVVFSSNGEGNVTCRCSNCFCLTCSGEGHAPVDCGTLSEWMSERTRQSENWVLAYTIQCPRCKSKFDQGSFDYLFVECDLCSFQFCGTCGNDWNTNDESLGQWSHNCQPIVVNSLRESAKNSLERYNLYYQEWVTCESSRENALADLTLFRDLQLELLCGIFSLSANYFDFLIEALHQISEGWQFLKWMHVYGYYLADNEHAKKHLFEFMQGEARSLVERLHTHVEQLQDFLCFEVPFKQFMDFRSKTTMLTRVLRNYMAKLMEGLKGGLSEVICIPELGPRLKICQEQGENGCSQKSPDLGPSSSPTFEAMRE